MCSPMLEPLHTEQNVILTLLYKAQTVQVTLYQANIDKERIAVLSGLISLLS